MLQRVQPAKDERSAALRVCDALGIEVLTSTTVTRRANQTHALAAITNLVHHHGEGHAIFVLRLFVETEPNVGALTADTIFAVSDVLAAHPEWMERGLELFDAFDGIDLNALRLRAKEHAVAPLRGTIAVLLAERLAGDLEFMYAESEAMPETVCPP